MHIEAEGPDAQILIVDDNPANILLLSEIYEFAGYKNVHSTLDPTEVEGLCRTIGPDLIVLDLHMPKMSGYELLAAIRKQRPLEEFLPILVFSADVTPEARKTALKAGANDFLTKPGDATEILIRTANFLKMRWMYQAMSAQKLALEERVRERTEELERAQIEVVERLARTAEYRDDDTGHHAKRVGETSGKIAQNLGLPEHECRLIELAATLHDLGKVGIPDGILLKQGKLTIEEFEEMKGHTSIGAKICSGSTSPLLIAAEVIAASHHEKWDGTGYPTGAAGDEIPLYGRICAVADVYDALRTERPYKLSMTHDAAIEIILKDSGRHFDPRVVDAFLRTFANGSTTILKVAA